MKCKQMCHKNELRTFIINKNSNYCQNIIEKNYFKIKKYDGYTMQHPSDRIYGNIAIIIQSS